MEPKSEAQRNGELFLRYLASDDPRYRQFAIQPRDPSRIPTNWLPQEVPSYLTSGVNSGTYQVDPTWRDSRALVLPDGTRADAGGAMSENIRSWSPREGESVFPESWTGWDFSMDVTPKEMFDWYTSPQYLGPEHRKYISDAASLLDEPLIPRVPASLAGWAGPPADGDITPRQFLDSLPSIAYTQAVNAAESDPGNAEKQARMQQATEQYLLSMAGGSKPFSETPDGQAVWAALTGQAYDRKAHPHASDHAVSMINAIGSGRTNRYYENDPSISQSEFAQLQQQYGDEAYKMLTPGGVANARREAAYDFFGAMQGDSSYAPHLDNTSAALMALASGASADMDSPVTAATMRQNQDNPYAKRMETMMMPGLAGRMKLASEKLSFAQGEFAKAGGEKPFVTTASLLNRTDPMSAQGLYNLAGNSSWWYGRNIQNPYEPFFGEMMTRGQLGDRGLEFFQDLNDRTFREAPLRPDGQTPEQFRQTRAYTIDRRNSNLDYYDTFAPLLADAYNTLTLQGKSDPSKNPFPAMPRTYPTQLTSIGYQMPAAVGRSAAQSAMIGVPVAGSAGKAAMTGKGLTTAAAKGALTAGLVEYPLEVAQEGLEEVLQNPSQAGGLLDTKEYNAWMRPEPAGTLIDDGQGGQRKRTREEYLRMLDPRNKDEWNRGVEETKARRMRQTQEQYQQWDQNNPRRPELLTQGFGPILLN